MNIYDHRTTPPVAYHTTGPCVTIGAVCIRVTNLPEGVYADGGADPVPDGQIATAWARVVRDGLSVAVPTCEPAPDPLATRAAALWADEAVQYAVGAILARIEELVAMGVAMDDWTIQGVAAAAEAAVTLETKADMTQKCLGLWVAWERLVLHAGSMAEAEALWPYLYDLATTA